MLQSSITAWLKKPATVVKPKESTPTPTSAHTSHLSPLQPAVEGAAATKTEEWLPPLARNNFALPALPPNVQLVQLTEDLIPGFKRLTALTLPVSYPPVFFAESMTEPFHSITLIALWKATPLASGSASNTEKPRVVGAIRCRLLPSSTLYISTISLLAPYRSHGIASHLLHNVLVKAYNEHGIKSVTAHVWEANEDGLEWYEKRGFEVIGKEDKYYNKLKPPGAILVRKWVGVSDLLASTNKTDSAPL